MPHYADKMPEYAKYIDTLCKAILALTNKNWKPYRFVQINKDSHPGAITGTLEGMIQHWDQIKDPWPYAETILKTKNGQFSERKHAEEKREWAEYCSKSSKLKDLARGIG